MNTNYVKPTQSRALKSQEQYLEAFVALLEQMSFKQITATEIARKAGLERSAFIKRFGNKQGALEILWERYIALSLRRVDQLAQEVLAYPTMAQALQHISEVTEDLQTRYFAVNRAMMDVFEAELQTHPLTKSIFQRGMALMRGVRQHFHPQSPCLDSQVFAATQLLITLNYNWAMKAMPGMPRDSETRHRLIGELLALTLCFDAQPSAQAVAV